MGKWFGEYFPEDLRINFEWIETPFKLSIIAANISTDLENQLIELSCDNKLKEMFDKHS